MDYHGVPRPYEITAAEYDLILMHRAQQQLEGKSDFHPLDSVHRSTDHAGREESPLRTGHPQVETGTEYTPLPSYAFSPVPGMSSMTDSVHDDSPTPIGVDDFLDEGRMQNHFWFMSNEEDRYYFMNSRKGKQLKHEPVSTPSPSFPLQNFAFKGQHEVGASSSSFQFNAFNGQKEQNSFPTFTPITNPFNLPPIPPSTSAAPSFQPPLNAPHVASHVGSHVFSYTTPGVLHT